MKRRIYIWTMMMVLVVGGSASEGLARTSDEVRNLLETLLNTHYCGDVLLDGLAGANMAIKGQIPISGNRTFDLPEAEWLPMLKEMAKEEIVSLNSRLADTLAEMRSLEAAGKRRDNSNDEGSSRLWNLQERIWSERARLESMAIYLRYATIETNQVLDLLENIEKECPRECGLYVAVNMSLVDKACRDGQSWRCAELGSWYRENYGHGGHEEWELFNAFARYGLPQLRSDEDRQKGMKYLAEDGDSLSDPKRAGWFDQLALEFLPSWTRSLQRRQLAERCLMSAESGETSETPTERVQRICPWAAAELAADESDLTDLREVYGDWTNEKTIPDPIR